MENAIVITPANVGPGKASWTCIKCGLTFPSQEIAEQVQRCPQCKRRGTIELIRRMPGKSEKPKQLEMF